MGVHLVYFTTIGLKPTYEEWKLGVLQFLENHLYSLKPTYEEWKHCVKELQDYLYHLSKAYL